MYLHPARGKSVGMAPEIAHGSCTDVPPAQVNTALRYKFSNGPRIFRKGCEAFMLCD